MAGNEKQKLKLLYLLKIFREKTDDDHVMSAADFCEELLNTASQRSASPSTRI